MPVASTVAARAPPRGGGRGDVVDRHAGQPRQLEGVGRDDVGGRHGGVAHELGDAGLHEDPPVVADHRVEQPERARVRRAQARRGAEERRALVGGAEVAAEQRVAAGEPAARVERGDEAPDLRRGRHLSREAAMAGVVREAHGVDAPGLVAHALQAELGRGIADMAVDHAGLDRQDVHLGSSRGLSVARRP
jgi:hypothetical protein